MVVLTNDELTIMPRTKTTYHVRGAKLGSLRCKRLDDTPVVDDTMLVTATVLVTRDWIQIIHPKFGRAEVIYPA